MNKLVENRWVAILWAGIRIWLGVQWLEAGLHKIGAFDASGFLQGAIAKAGGEAPIVQGWYAAFLEQFALPNVELFNFLIPAGEVMIGLGLIFGALTVPALIAGAFMNLNFLLAGTISTNPILLAVAIILLFAYKGTMVYGVDRFMIPFAANKMKERHHFKKIHEAEAH